uniref:Uncharacterized protein n=1 Tax=Agaricus bisporus virus 16 TaxID=1945746 RepID=A0A1Q1M969_9VIRU|nr:hypothetical protein [Agaricus bisporus virus 16]
MAAQPDNSGKLTQPTTPLGEQEVWHYAGLGWNYKGHRHECVKCGHAYIHYHPAESAEHTQFAYQCPTMTCDWYMGLLAAKDATRRPTLSLPDGPSIDMSGVMLAAYIGYVHFPTHYEILHEIRKAFQSTIDKLCRDHVTTPAEIKKRAIVLAATSMAVKDTVKMPPYAVIGGRILFNFEGVFLRLQSHEWIVISLHQDAAQPTQTTSVGHSAGH